MTKRLPRTTALMVLAISALGAAPAAHADYQQRLSLGVGVAMSRNASQTSFEIGAEYEYRMDPMLGLGAFGNYVFSSPGVAYIGAPEVFIHPLATEFLVSASPFLRFGSGVGTHLGLRLGTRVPLPLGAITIVPNFAIDLISGGPDYIIGVGIEF